MPMEAATPPDADAEPMLTPLVDARKPHFFFVMARVRLSVVLDLTVTRESTTLFPARNVAPGRQYDAQQHGI